MVRYLIKRMPRLLERLGGFNIIRRMCHLLHLLLLILLLDVSMGEASSSLQLRPVYSTNFLVHHSLHKLASSISLRDTRAFLPVGVAGRPHRSLLHKFPLKERSLEVDMLYGPTVGSNILTEKSISRSG